MMCKERLFVLLSNCPKIALSQAVELHAERNEVAITQALSEKEVLAMLRKGGLGIVTDWKLDAFR